MVLTQGLRPTGAGGLAGAGAVMKVLKVLRVCSLCTFLFRSHNFIVGPAMELSLPRIFFAEVSALHRTCGRHKWRVPRSASDRITRFSGCSGRDPDASCGHLDRTGSPLTAARTHSTRNDYCRRERDLGSRKDSNTFLSVRRRRADTLPMRRSEGRYRYLTLSTLRVFVLSSM